MRQTDLIPETVIGGLFAAFTLEERQEISRQVESGVPFKKAIDDMIEKVYEWQQS